jgi:hypothetical protein
MTSDTQSGAGTRSRPVSSHDSPVVPASRVAGPLYTRVVKGRIRTVALAPRWLNYAAPTSHLGKHGQGA